MASWKKPTAQDQVLDLAENDLTQVSSQGHHILNPQHCCRSNASPGRAGRRGRLVVMDAMNLGKRKIPYYLGYEKSLDDHDAATKDRIEVERALNVVVSSRGPEEDVWGST